jgi:hypothetical protein
MRRIVRYSQSRRSRSPPATGAGKRGVVPGCAGDATTEEGDDGKVTGGDERDGKGTTAGVGEGAVARRPGMNASPGAAR